MPDAAQQDATAAATAAGATAAGTAQQQQQEATTAATAAGTSQQKQSVAVVDTSMSDDEAAVSVRVVKSGGSASPFGINAVPLPPAAHKKAIEPMNVDELIMAPTFKDLIDSKQQSSTKSRPA